MSIVNAALSIRERRVARIFFCFFFLLFIIFFFYESSLDLAISD